MPFATLLMMELVALAQLLSLQQAEEAQQQLLPLITPPQLQLQPSASSILRAK